MEQCLKCPSSSLNPISGQGRQCIHSHWLESSHRRCVMACECTGCGKCWGTSAAPCGWPLGKQGWKKWSRRCHWCPSAPEGPSTPHEGPTHMRVDAPSVSVSIMHLAANHVWRCTVRDGWQGGECGQPVRRCGQCERLACAACWVRTTKCCRTCSSLAVPTPVHQQPRASSRRNEATEGCSSQQDESDQLAKGILWV